MSSLIENLVSSKFFGEEFHVTNRKIQALNQCFSYSEFLKIKDMIDDDFKKHIFELAGRKDLASRAYTNRECRAIYLRLRLVSTGADFI